MKENKDKLAVTAVDGFCDIMHKYWEQITHQQTILGDKFTYFVNNRCDSLESQDMFKTTIKEALNAEVPFEEKLDILLLFMTNMKDYKDRGFKKLFLYL